MQQYCFLNGKIVPLEEAKVSVLDIGLLRGYGIYDGIPAFAGKPFHFVDHWNRFLSGAHALNLNVPITEERAEKVVIELLEKNGMQDRANVRFILTGGQVISGIEYAFETPTFYIITERWEKLPDELYKDGGKLITYRYRRDLPEYKTTNYIRAVNLQEFKKTEKAVEILFVYDGDVFECATSNVFIVKDKTLITPEEGILKGITRKVVLEIGAQKYKVEERPIEEVELKTADEVFITSSFKDIVPIVKIDDFSVGNGLPAQAGEVGEVTQDLMAQYKDVIANFA